MDLFEEMANRVMESDRPLADRMRPRDLSEFIGQVEAIGPDTPLYKAISQDKLFSMILWGPPGCGKTTLAKIIARKTKSRFIQISAVLSGVKDIRNVIDEAKKERIYRQRRTILFVDEIHRFNKAQQDAFLHHVETGYILLIGATTENPSFSVIPALLSRCRVIKLTALNENEIRELVLRALADDERGLGRLGVAAKENAVEKIAAASGGDARAALSILETAAMHAAGAKTKTITAELIEKVWQKKILYDKNGEEHYNLISAFHKSLRGSDPDAALYWLARMLKGGEDPLYIARRMIRFAAEDVGVADPRALTVACSAMEAYRFLGSPEGELCLAEAAVYLATAPKSNSIYTAFNKAMDTVDETGYLPVPLHLRNAPTKLMDDMGYGDGYKYPHDFPGAYVSQQYLPDKIKEEKFYSPSPRGFEKWIQQRLEYWKKHDS